MGRARERQASAEGCQAVARVEATPAAVDQAAAAGDRAHRAPFGAAPKEAEDADPMALFPMR
jgi:hypothetical protein